jgi:hypothetical protein
MVNASSIDGWVQFRVSSTKRKLNKREVKAFEKEAIAL